MTPLQVGIVGLGAFGESHIQTYRGLPEVEVAAVASRSAARAREVAARYCIPRWYGNYDALIADPAIQAVSVTTAEAEHRAPAVAALAAGKHVLVEKPLATTLDDALALAAAARAARGILMPGHVLRFEAKYATLRAAVEAGELGRLVALDARRNRPRSAINTYARVHPAFVTAIHDLDIMLWLAGSPLRRVRALDRLADRDGGAHGVWALLEFASGVIGTIEAAWMVPSGAGLATDDAFSAIGTAGLARLQFDPPPLRIWRDTGQSAPDTSYEPRVHGLVTGALRDELAYFAACARRGEPPTVVTPEDGVLAVAAALALVESARRDTEIAVAWPAGF
jgi:UDP-N-acetylglucosamine 3-dehydrogenase